METLGRPGGEVRAQGEWVCSETQPFVEIIAVGIFVPGVWMVLFGSMRGIGMDVWLAVT